MPTLQNKIALREQSEVQSKNNRTHLNRFIDRVQAKLTRSVWRSTYSLELARQDHADAGHLWSQAWCCIGLSFVRMIGGGV